jgi:hypothetical protein
VKLHSEYLNPFQPFSEREIDEEECEDRRPAIEDNLTRAVFSALANARDTQPLVVLLRALSAHAQSSQVQEQVGRVIAALVAADPAHVEWDVQRPLERALPERDTVLVLLIGIPSSHVRKWTHKDRCASECCRADAWVYVPGKALIVFECKNDSHPLDGTQMWAYAHDLGLVPDEVGIPRPSVGSTLRSPAEGLAVQELCKNFVLDAPWATVVSALNQIAHAKEVVDDGGRWLCEQAVTYLDAHHRPRYEGPITILEWLKGKDTATRRAHLRSLVREMGRSLTESEGIAFVVDEGNEVDVRRGAGAACYVHLSHKGEPLTRKIAGKAVAPVLWFDFATDGSNAPRIGLEYYLQASGACTESKGKAKWNEASRRHAECARRFDEQIENWVREHDRSDARVSVEGICFRGRKRNWMGGGAACREAPASGTVSPQEALKFLRARHAELWRFPTVESGGEEAIQAAAKQVRKPAVSIILPITPTELIECGSDARSIQAVLERLLAAS